jgi:hypothetical protein
VSKLARVGKEQLERLKAWSRDGEKKAENLLCRTGLGGKVAVIILTAACQ